MAQKNKTDKENEPVHKFPLGRIRVAIWANTAKNGSVWLNVAITRKYKDGDKWKDTTTFSRDDLPIVAKAADMAYAWIWEQYGSTGSSEMNE